MNKSNIVPTGQTIKIQLGAASTAVFQINQTPPSTNSTLIPETTAEKINAWYFEPLNKMNNREGFIILMICLPLYEKYLRIVHGLVENTPKTLHHRTIIANDFNLSDPDDVMYFWDNIRNGLLHRAIPQAKSFPCGICNHGPAIEITNGPVKYFWVNPFAMKTLIVNILKANAHIWDDDTKALLPDSYID